MNVKKIVVFTKDLQGAQGRWFVNGASGAKLGAAPWLPFLSTCYQRRY
jgi:hypothetical protein